MVEAWSVSTEFYQLIKLVAIGATGMKTNIEISDWASVLKLAQEQSVLPLLGVALMKNTNIECPDRLRDQLLVYARNETERNFVRKLRILHMLHEMELAGIHAQLVKGYSVGDYYAFPESRNSVDSDILVPFIQEEKACQYLRDKGFRVDHRSKVGHHSVCQHPQLGMVELHVQLYDEIVQDAWFCGIDQGELLAEQPLLINNQDMPYSTLGHTDHLLFLTLHAVKHFINSGMGLRMMTDIAVYFSKNCKQINIERFWRVMTSLNYDRVVNCILWIMVDTGCFSLHDFPGIQKERPSQIHLLLYDLETGGHMGVKEQDRHVDSYEYSRQRLLKKKNPMQYRIYMLKHKIRAANHQMLPRKSGSSGSARS